MNFKIKLAAIFSSMTLLNMNDFKKEKNLKKISLPEKNNFLPGQF